MEFALTEDQKLELIGNFEIDDIEGVIARFESIANYILKTPEMSQILANYDSRLLDAAYAQVIEESMEEYMSYDDERTGKISTLLSINIISERILHTYTISNLNILKRIKDRILEEKYPDLISSEFKHLVKSKNPDLL